MTIGKGAFAALAFLAMMAGGVFLPAISLSAEAGDSKLSFISPSRGAVLPAGRVLVIGKAHGRGSGRVEVDVNGKGKQAVTVDRGAFSVHVTLSTGSNVIRASGGGSAATLDVKAAAKGTYAYHEPVGKCAECHGAGGAGYTLAGPRDKLCYRCHGRMDGKRFAHGPMGNGECTACHDPHGSSNRALSVSRPDQLCVSCHDQKASSGHIAGSRGKACTSCHDPHSSDSSFLLR